MSDSSIDMCNVSAMTETPGTPSSSTYQLASARVLITKSSKRLSGSR